MKKLQALWKKLITWELWPFEVIYSPLVFVWLYYACKARAFWFFSNVNPTLEFAGFEGETKKEMYQQLPCHLYPETIHLSAQIPVEDVLQQLYSSPINFPLAVKPEVGMQGILFRKIDDEAQLLNYHQLMPADYVIQQWVDFPVELSVFYIRYPGNSKGKITGLIFKEYMYVTGDGSTALWQLIQQHAKAKHRLREMQHKHRIYLQKILPAGEKYTLSIAGNHNRGARFINLRNEIDERLTTVLDNLSLYATQFYYGRYDIKCASLENLKQAENFKIIEYNGAGAEPNHIYDCNMHYWHALHEIVRHWKCMYEIGKINRQQSVPYWPFMKGLKFLKKSSTFFKQLRKIDEQIV